MIKPMVSIIIPVYNGDNYLREAIDSALAQTYQNIEVIVINDGSRDQRATENIALSYGDKIRYFQKENGGVATALNLGILNMKGEYFSWLSHDDMYYPQKIERQINALSEFGDMTALIHSDYDLLEVTTQSITHVKQSEIYPEEQLTNSVFPIIQGLVHGCSLLIHKSHFIDHGTFNETLITTQDYDLWFRIFRNKKTIFIPESLVLSRLHDEQGSKTIASYNSERDELYSSILRDLTEHEMSSMYGSPYNFYHRMYCFFKGVGMSDSCDYAFTKFQEAVIPSDLEEQLLYLRTFIDSLSNSQAERICIFGAGEYGTRLYQELSSKLIHVDCFSDNNPKKWGGIFNHVECISPEQLEKEKDRTLILVASRTPTEIMKQLKLQGYQYVTTKQDIDYVLLQVPPSRKN